MMRIVTGALAAVFALPSCITSNLWRGRYQTTGDPVPSRLHVLDAASAVERGDDTAFAVDVGPLGAEFARLCNPPRETPVRWLRLRPRDNAESVQTLLAAGKRLTLRIGRDSSATRPPLPRCQLHSFLGSAPFEDPRLSHLPGSYKTIYLYVNRYFATDCDVDLLDAPPPAGEGAVLDLQWLDGPDGTLECVLITPVTLALDAVIFPLELLWLLGG